MAELELRMGRAVRNAPRALMAAVAALGIAALMFSTACYTYTVRSPGDLSAGRMVSAQLNNVGKVAVTSTIGDDALVVEGKFISADETNVNVAVTRVDYASGSSTTFPSVAVTIPRNGILVLNEKEFSRAKTTAIALGLGAALVAALTAFGLAGLGQSNNDTKPPNPPNGQ